MEVETETSSAAASSLPGELVSALEQATLMAKQLPIAPDPSHLLQIHAALHSAHRHLSLFLHPPSFPPTPHPENSVSSAVGGGGEEPMQIGDDEYEQNSRAVDMVEGRLKECSIRNKRLKRPLSPSAAERHRSYEDVSALSGGAAWAAEFNPVGNKLMSLDLVYQFHA